MDFLCFPMDFLCFPMEFLWISYGFPMEFLWISYGFPMDSQWIPMDVLWIPMDFLWISYGLRQKLFGVHALDSFFVTPHCTRVHAPRRLQACQRPTARVSTRLDPLLAFLAMPTLPCGYLGINIARDLNWSNNYSKGPKMYWYRMVRNITGTQNTHNAPNYFMYSSFRIHSASNPLGISSINEVSDISQSRHSALLAALRFSQASWWRLTRSSREAPYRGERSEARTGAIVFSSRLTFAM